MITIQQIEAANVQWFSKGAKKFSNDRSYYAYTSKVDKKVYLIRSSYMFSDMFGGQKKLSYTINEINQETLKIGSLINDDRHSVLTFDSLQEAKKYLG